MEYILLEIPEVKGESTLEGFLDKLELLSYSWGVSNPVQPSPSNVGRTTGRPNFSELVVAKKMDSTSPILADDCASAKNLGTVKMFLARQDEGADATKNLIYMTYELSNTLISSVSVSGGGDIPIESISFNYSAINWIYKSQKTEAGVGETIARGWDQATNKEAEVTAAA